MAHIVEHLSVEELEARYRAAQDATEARHLQAIWLLAQGRTFLEVAEVLAFVPRWVEQLAARYNASGPEALGDQRRRKGRAARLLTPQGPRGRAEAPAARGRGPPGGGAMAGPPACSPRSCWPPWPSGWSGRPRTAGCGAAPRSRPGWRGAPGCEGRPRRPAGARRGRLAG